MKSTVFKTPQCISSHKYYIDLSISAVIVTQKFYRIHYNRRSNSEMRTVFFGEKNLLFLQQKNICKKGAAEEKNRRKKNTNKQIIMNKYFTHQHYKRDHIVLVERSARGSGKNVAIWMWKNINNTTQTVEDRRIFDRKMVRTNLWQLTAVFLCYTIRKFMVIYSYSLRFRLTGVACWCSHAEQ